MGRLSDVISHRWAVMGLWLVTSVSGIAMMIAMGILLPAISAELGLTPSQQGFFGSSAFLGNLLLALPLSWWISKYSPKLVTTITLVLGVIFLFIQGWAPNLAILLIGRFGYGITTLAREPARALLMYQWFQPREFMVVNSVYNALFGIVVGGGLFATPFILASAGDNWRIVLYSFVAVLTVLTILWAVFGRERVTESDNSQDSEGQFDMLRRVFRHRDLWISGFGFLGATMGWSAFLTFYPTLMLETHQVSLNWSGAILAVGILVGGVVGVALSYMIMAIGPDRRKNTVQALGLIMMASYLVMTMVDSIPMLLVISALNGVAWGFWPILNSVPFYLPGIRSREVAIALSLVMTLSSLGVVLGPTITGILQEQFGDLTRALQIVSFAPLSLTIAGTVLRIRTDAEPDPQPVS
jgi:MFS family permease